MAESHASGEELVDPRWAIAPGPGESPGHAWSIARTLGAELERVRLAHRAGRVERALAALVERREEEARVGTVRPALSSAIDDLSHELAQLRARLSGMPSTTAEPAFPAHIVGASSPTTVPRKARA